MMLSPDSVRRSLSRINARKAPGPDKHSGHVLRDCAVGTHWCLHRHFQHLTKSGCCPHMLQSYHHHSSPDEVISILLQWLPSSSTHSYSHEVLWTASHATHQVCPPPSLDPFHIGPTARPMMPSPLPSTQPSHIWTKKTHMSGCCSYTSVQHSTQSSLNSSLTNWSSWGSTPLCANGFWTSWPGDLRRDGSAYNTSSTLTLNTGAPQGCVLSPLPLHSADPDWTPSHTLTFSLSLRMNRLWWVSLATEMRQTTGARWAAWPGGAGTTISPWMWRRRRRLLLTSGECTLSMLLWPSTVRLWREWAAPSSWGCTSQRTSPGLTTLRHWPRKHSSVSTSSANSEEPEPRPPSCAPSTETPSRASWLAASLCGMALATHPAASHFNA